MFFDRSWGVVVAVVCIAWTSPASAQDGTVQGRVRDEEGSAVYGATVALLAPGAPLRASDTDRLGSFRITGVLPRPYQVRVQALGYAEYVESISLGPGGTLELDLRIERQAIEMEGISVEAERSRERIRFEEVGGATVRELNLADLKGVPGIAEADPIRAIEVLPGVVSTSDFSASFHVRGGSADQNLILLDGVPVFSPFHLGGLFSVFNADMLDRAELQSGGFAAEHGGRVSSVLQIESDAGDGQTQVDAGVSLLASRVAVGGGVPKSAAARLGLANLRWRASARRSYFDVLMKPVFDFPYHLTDLQGVLEGWTPAGDRVSITAYSGRDVLDLTQLDAEDFPLRIDWDWGNNLVGARWTRARRGGGALDVRINYSRFDNGLSFPDFGDTEFRSFIGQAQARIDLDARPTANLKVQTGGSVERLRYDNLFRSGGTDFGGGKGTGVLAAGYGQLDWSQPGEWLLEAGVRVESWAPDPGATSLEISPRFAMKRFLGRDAALKLAAGRYAQYVHSLRDEELPLGLDIWVIAGDRAPHVVSNQVQIGLEGYRDIDWFWSVEAYARSFDGVVTFNPGEDPNDDFDDILAGDGLSYGADLLIRKETGDVNGWVALSVVKADRTFPDPLSPLRPSPEVTYPPIFDRRVDIDFVLRFPAPWGWEGGLRWNFGSGIPYTRALGSYAYYSPRFVDGGGRQRWAGGDDASDDLGGYAVVLGDRNSSRYPSYHRLDVNFRKTLERSWGSMTPYVDLVNAYNRRNVLFYFFQYENSPATRSGISMFPLLPTFGLEVRF